MLEKILEPKTHLEIRDNDLTINKYVQKRLSNYITSLVFYKNYVGLFTIEYNSKTGLYHFFYIENLEMKFVESFETCKELEEFLDIFHKEEWSMFKKKLIERI